MPHLRNRVPSYRRHKATGQAVVTLNGRDIYLGKFNTAASRHEYSRIIAEWIAVDGVLPDASRDITVTELAAAFMRHARAYYRGSQEAANFKPTIRRLVDLYGRTRAADFGPVALKAVREEMIAEALGRKSINQRINRIKHIFKWAVENGLITPSVLHGLQAVAGLRFGRSDARETASVKPVPETFVDAIIPFVSPQVGAMIELQRITGMRSGEVTIMRSCDIDMRGRVWVYTVPQHKAAWRGQDRRVYLGPRAQALLQPFLKPELQAYIFSPRDASAQLQQVRHAKRTTSLRCGNRPGTNRRLDKLGVAIGDLNERIAAKLEELETDDIDVQQRLERELTRDYHVITADKRLDQVARDFVHHYSTAWETGKAMLVCIDKVTCVRMHGLIAKYWDERIKELAAELLTSVDEQEADYRRRQITWMRETRAAVVISEEQGEVEKFRRWGLDIIPHRRLIKQGIELPASMRSKPQFRNMQQMDLDLAFKEEEHPFRIAIVCAMWLTGFDVPSLSTLYLDKPLKAHTLMQAIARANRVHEGKNNGLIVDYCGILKNLRKALATFAGTLSGGRPGRELDPARPEEELLAELAEAIEFTRAFLYERNVSLQEVIDKVGFERNAAIVACKVAANENDETRKRFEVLCREVFKKFKACITVQGVTAHRADRDAINIVYQSLQRDREQADISAIIRQLHQVVDDAIDTTSSPPKEHHAPYDISKIDFDRLKQEFQRTRQPNSTVQNLRQVVESRLQQLLQRNPLRTDFQRHFEEVVAGYNSEKDRITIERTFEALIRLVQELDEESTRAIREGLDEESLAIFDLLKKPDLTAADIKRIKAVATDLLAALKAEKLRVYAWREREGTRDAVRTTIYDYLYSDATGLPATYDESEIRDRAEEVFRHVYRVYPTVPSPIYETSSVAS